MTAAIDQKDSRSIGNGSEHDPTVIEGRFDPSTLATGQSLSVCEEKCSS
jgi:hypothetical protein